MDPRIVNDTEGNGPIENSFFAWLRSVTLSRGKQFWIGDQLCSTLGAVSQTAAKQNSPGVGFSVESMHDCRLTLLRKEIQVLHDGGATGQFAIIPDPSPLFSPAPISGSEKL